MAEALICDGVRTPIGRYGGCLSSVRTDDLAALPIRALIERNKELDLSSIEEVALGCANQAGEDNRNVARMAALLAGLPESVPGATVNRLCASGMDAVGMVARAIRAGDYGLAIAGGVESMSRAPFVMPKTTQAFGRQAEIHDTTIGWRFVNPEIKALYGIDSMPETGDNVAREWNITREAQDRFALQSQQRCAAALKAGHFHDEITPVTISERRGAEVHIAKDEQPRPQTDFEALARLRGVNGLQSTVTAGNASSINDGAAALLLANAEAAAFYGLQPMARVCAMVAIGVAPRVMGIGPVPAIRKLEQLTDVSLDQIEVIELNEAFAAQAVACLNELGLNADDPRVNAYGGAIALGHPLGMTGARLILTAAYRLQRSSARFALCAMCVGVGQGTAILLERV